MTFIKPDPEMLQEEQEDLIMSYLNADYLSTDTPLSPPSSTSSSSETTGSPEKHSVDDFMLDINTDFLGGDQHAWTTNNTSDLFNPCLPQQHHPSDLLNAFPFFLPSMDVANAQFIQPMPVTAASANVAANEQPKKRRGRKKRDTTAPAPCVPQPSLLAPKPLAPRPDVQIKQEPMAIDVSSSGSSSPLAGPTNMMNETVAISQLEPQQQQQKQTTPPPPPPPLPASQPTSIEAQKQAQIQKRQERLIKNRAAALLSRKRKREHLSLLEEEKQNLLIENETLVHKVNTLESRIQSLEKENMELKEKLEQTQSVNSSNTVIHVGNNKRNLIHNGQKPSKATGVVFMIILFSFALFTLPSRTSDRLTVGGSSVLSKKQFPLIGSTSSDEMDYSVEQFCQQHAEYCDEAMEATTSTSTSDVSTSDINSTDLVLIDSVRPRDLQTWINHKLDVSSDSVDNDKKLISWFPNNANEKSSDAKDSNDGHVYLYSKEFSQLASMHSTQSQSKDKSPPTISLVSPYNQTATTQDSYLQIDVQVLRSQVIKGQLMSLQQYGSASTALLDGMKKDLISSNVTRSNKKEDYIVKREKRTKKISRVII
ncbi:uncharacterized protein ATC70_002666 [Mucor velutinosus]|uniref:BZIP domain-containing protein n=1 Tax=Mucor velutinosus TaxID=708070 RepID=A0AAN7DCQ9_9FUNG|nr:hypothetical protein ATC70_002666 [Mucor velutinosus]